MSSASSSGRAAVIRSSSRWKSSRRSDCEVTRWLQPAHADPGAPRPWARSSTSAPDPPPHQPLGTTDGPDHNRNLTAAAGIPVRGYRPQGQASVISRRRNEGIATLAAITYTAGCAGFKTIDHENSRNTRSPRERKRRTTNNTNSHE